MDRNTFMSLEEKFSTDHVWFKEVTSRGRRRQLTASWQLKRRAGQAAIQAELAAQGPDQFNERQLECIETNHQLVVVQGYPGTGKTHTLAATVHRRFGQLLARPSGWIVCLTDSNVSALQMTKYIVRYVSLQPFVTHAYSSMYRAYHETDFAVSYPYRLTPKQKLTPHGILVCTLGCLSKVLMKWPKLKDIVFDLVTDESGLFWDFDALLIVSPFERLMRWILFGDQLQLLPYVTRMLSDDRYFDSIMWLILRRLESGGSPSNSPLHIKLNTQYRMIPELCEIHSRIFYDYPIISARKPKLPVEAYGFFVDQLPNLKELKGLPLLEYEANRAIDIAIDIHNRGLVNDDGEPYTFCIITSYIKTRELVLRKIREQEIAWLNVSTINGTQGNEFDVIIQTTSRVKCADLNKDRNRGNVGGSRARDIHVLLIHECMAKSTLTVHVEPVHQKIRFWEQFVMRGKSIRGYDPRLKSIQTELVLWHHNNQQEARGISTHWRETGINKFMQGARAALNNLPAIYDCLESRMQLGKDLLLKPRMHQNKLIHKNLFLHLVRCDIKTFTRALDVIANVYKYPQRNDQLCDLIGLNFNNPITADDEAVVKRMYPDM